MNRSLVIGLLFFLTVPAAPGDDETWNNIYHSLSRFGDNVRNTFTEDASDRPSATPRGHRKGNSKHSSLKKTKAKASASPSGSSNEKSDASDNASAAGSEKPTPSPSSTPVPAEEGGSASKDKPENAAPMATIKPEALREFAAQPPRFND